MMNIQLSDHDLARLSEAALDEILKLAHQTGERSKALSERASSAPVSAAETGGISNLTPQQMRLFLSGVSPNTRKGLKLFIDNRGRVSIGQLEAIGLTSKAFAAALTRRARTTLNNPKAYLYDWDWDTHEYLLSPTTLQSLTEVLASE